MYSTRSRTTGREVCDVTSPLLARCHKTQVTLVRRNEYDEMTQMNSAVPQHFLTQAEIHIPKHNLETSV